MLDSAPQTPHPWLVPHRVVAVLILVFGTCFAVTTPPAQPPDEREHWERVWQLSKGVAIATDYGGDVPKSLVDCAERFQPLCFHNERHTSISAVWQEFSRPLRADITEHRRFAAQTTYSPLPYLPQAVATAVGRSFDAPPIVLLQEARIANVLGYALVCWGAVRALPILKWPACMILAAPLPLFLAGSMSVDPLSIAFAFLATALILRMILGPTDTIVGNAAVAAVALSLIAVALSKSAYFPICGLLLFVPGQRWGTTRRRWICVGLVCVLTVSTTGAWAYLTKPMHASFAGFDPGVQMAWVDRHPFRFLIVLFNTLWSNRTFLIYCTVGNLGCLDTPLSVQSLDLYFAALAWVVLNYDADVYVSPRLRLGGAAATAASVLLFSVFLYVQMNAAGSATIVNMQGRYFLPLGLFICLLFHRRGRYVVHPTVIAAGMTLFGAYAVYVAASRYY